VKSEAPCPRQAASHIIIRERFTWQTGSLSSQKQTDY
jgi:hypothetical protein